LFRPAWQRRLSSRRLEPIEHEERAFDLADLLESKIELGLPFVSGQFLQHRRRRGAAGLEGRNEPQDLIPALGDDVGLDALARERFKTRVSRGRFRSWRDGGLESRDDFSSFVTSLCAAPVSLRRWTRT
jgi:hypothetical protein